MTMRRVLGISAIALAALAVAWTVAWFVIADRLRQGIDRWAAARRAEGWVVEYGDVVVSGFPFTWQGRIAEPRLVQRAHAPAFLWAGPALELTWQPWKANVVGFRSAGTHRLGLGPAGVRAPLRLDMADVRGLLDFGTDGRLRRIGLHLNRATVTPPAGESVRLNRLVATLDTAPGATGEKPDQDHLQPSLRVDGELFGLTLPAKPRPALGRTIAHIALHGAVMGRIPAANPNEALDRWRQDGGTVEIDRLELRWATLTVRANGTLALDAALQPVGALTAKITGYSETADALLVAGLLKPGQALVAKIALGALAHTPEGGGPPQIDVPLAAQDGWLFAGPVKLIPLPPVRWE